MEKEREEHGGKHPTSPSSTVVVAAAAVDVGNVAVDAGIGAGVVGYGCSSGGSEKAYVREMDVIRGRWRGTLDFAIFPFLRGCRPSLSRSNSSHSKGPADTHPPQQCQTLLGATSPLCAPRAV